MKNGKDFKDRENRTCRELLNLVLTIQDPKNTIEQPMRTMQQSEKWVYPSKDELAGIMLDRHEQGIYEYTYGPRIFNFQNQHDQIEEYIIPLLRKDPDSRRAAVVLYDPLNDSKLDKSNIPCLIFIYFKIIDHKLHVSCFIRSNDLFIGWPANVYQMYVLQEHVAEKLAVDVGELTTFSASAHIFEEHFEEITKIIEK